MSSAAWAAQVQKPAPAFTAQAVVDGQFKEVSLADYKGKYVVVYFYPLDFTFVCPTEVIAFSDRISEFRDINCEVRKFLVFLTSLVVILKSFFTFVLISGPEYMYTVDINLSCIFGCGLLKMLL